MYFINYLHTYISQLSVNSLPLPPRFVGNNRVRFLCKSCEDMNKFVICYSEIVIHNADDLEEDEYILDESTVPLPSEHHCTPSGMF